MFVVIGLVGDYWGGKEKKVEGIEVTVGFMLITIIFYGIFVLIFRLNFYFLFLVLLLII